MVIHLRDMEEQKVRFLPGLPTHETESVMITAAEAREIREHSSVRVQEILSQLEPDIRASAEKGLSELACYSVRELWTSVEAYNGRHATALQSRVMTELKELGYGVTFAPHGDQYVPRGLADDDGNGPSYQNWCIIIRW